MDLAPTKSNTLFLIGHTNIKGGAKMPDYRYPFQAKDQFISEFQFYSAVFREAKKITLGLNFQKHDWANVNCEHYSSRIKAAVDFAKQKNYSFVVEWHFNSFIRPVSPRALGLVLKKQDDTLPYFDTVWRFLNRWEEIFTELYPMNYKKKVTRVNPGDRGGGLLKALDEKGIYGVIMEPFFGNNPEAKHCDVNFLASYVAWCWDSLKS